MATDLPLLRILATPCSLHHHTGTRAVLITSKTRTSKLANTSMAITMGDYKGADKFVTLALGKARRKVLVVKAESSEDSDAAADDVAKQDAARKALEDALTSKKKDFQRWNEEVKAREAVDDGGSGGGPPGGFGGGGGGDGGGYEYSGEEDSWDEKLQVFLSSTALIGLYLVITRGKKAPSVVFDVLRWVLHGFRHPRNLNSNEPGVALDEYLEEIEEQVRQKQLRSKAIRS